MDQNGDRRLSHEEIMNGLIKYFNYKGIEGQINEIIHTLIQMEIRSLTMISSSKSF
jgi:hypothetical protein